MKNEYIIVVANWGYYYQLRELVDFLSDYSYEVTVILYDVNNPNLHDFSLMTNVNVINIPRNRFVELSSLYRTYVIRKYFSSKAVNSIQKQIIFFEKPSLIFFNSFNFLINLNKCYWSLELYLDPSLSVFKHIPNLRKHRKLEKRVINNINLLIIQDKYRADSFCENNIVKRFYWPVTLSESRMMNQTTNFSTDLIYIGVIRPERMLDSLIAWSKRNEYSLTLNGKISESYKSTIKGINPQLNISFFESFENIELQGKIGVVWYDNTDVNDRLTGSSSEKIANYLFHGIPIITNLNNESYSHLFINEAAFYVTSDNFKSTIDNILSNYEYYKMRAKSQYQMHYNSVNYFKKFLNNN